jgi:hypothetical protein
MPDWKTRLAVSYQDGGKTVDIVPIDAFTPSFSLNAEPVHSLEATHIGVIYSPQTLSFSMTVKAIGTVAGQLTALALQGKRFNVVLHESDSGGEKDWALKSVIMSDCIITSATPTAATISGAPAATFSGFSLQTTIEAKTGEKVTIP